MPEMKLPEMEGLNLEKLVSSLKGNEVVSNPLYIMQNIIDRQQKFIEKLLSMIIETKPIESNENISQVLSTLATLMKTKNDEE